MDANTLNEHFAIPGVLSFALTEGGLIKASIHTPNCAAELYLQGAHLTHWQPSGQEPVLFLSERSAFLPGKAIRGGVPIIFPWFGAPATSPVPAPQDAPSHGFARTQPWQVAFAAMAGEDLHLTLTLGPTDLSRAMGFDHFRLAFQLVLGAELKMQLSVANTGTTSLLLEEALHTYLHVADATQISLIGLSDTEFLDKTDSFKRKTQKEAPLRLTGETDRPYLCTEAPVDLDDPVLKRRITVEKSNSKTTVIWNPWSGLSAKLADMSPDGWQTMTCVETANVGTDAITLAPQQMHTMEARLVVQRFAE